MRLVFVHGRAQEGKDPVELRKTWENTLSEGLAAAGLQMPGGVSVAFPFYGDELDKLVKQMNAPLVEEVRTKGAAISDREIAFRAELATEIARNARLSTAEIESELPPGAKEKGPLQWEWVHAILKALDKNKKIGNAVVDLLTRDAYVYLTVPAAARKVDAIVTAAVEGDGPCVVVGHSLGSVVSYRVLTALAGKVDVRAFITVGSPLGLNAVRNHLPLPLAMPQKVGKWRNAYDERDVVALRALDQSSWPIDPLIENFNGVKNKTSNAHGIIGYLNDVKVAAWVHQGLK